MPGTMGERRSAALALIPDRHAALPFSGASAATPLPCA
jgi:hypothetical protein